MAGHGRITGAHSPGRGREDAGETPRQSLVLSPVRLYLNLLGGLTLSIDGREIGFPARKAKALLAYLALSPQQQETREKLVGMFWSEVEETKARASLRQALRALREVLESRGYRGLGTLRAEVGFSRGTVVTDIDRVFDSIAAGEPADLLLERSRVADTLLAGYDQIDPAFDMWLLVQRENLRQKLQRGLESRLSDTRLSVQRQRRIAEALLELDPTHENACQQVMRACVAAGDTAGALAAYNRLWTVLGEDFDMEPSEATQELVAQIKTGRLDGKGQRKAVANGSVARTAITPSGHKLIIAVGRFEPEGDAPHCATFRHELIRHLVRFREWQIIDGDALANLPAHSGTAYVITARMLSTGDVASFTIQLKEYGSGIVIWSDTYRLDVATFPASLQSVIHRLASVLNIYLSIERLRTNTPALEMPAQVYDLWLRGQSLVLILQPEAHLQAAEMFRTVIAQAPDFAPAYSCLAQIENAHHIVFAGQYRSPERLERGAAHARKACELDPLDSRAQLCLGWSYAMRDRFELAEANFRLALDLNEDDPWTMTSVALGLAYASRPEEALRLARTAIERLVLPSPLHWSYQCQIRFMCEDYEGALNAAEMAEDATPYLSGWKAAALALLNRPDQAQSEAQQFLATIRRRWFGAPDPSDFAIGNWFVSSFPIRLPSMRRHLSRALEIAGIPAHPDAPQAKRVAT